MAIEHPFQILFESFGRLPTVHADAVNRLAGQTLSAVLTVAPDHAGRCILLRAPRAGCGKTHVLSHIQHQLGSSHEFISLHAAAGPRIDTASVLDDTLREGHALVVADWDQDGVDEIVAGWRGGDGGLRLYDPLDDHGSGFRTIAIDQGLAVEGAVAADMNGDGRLDLVVIAGRTNNLVWYENRAH